jgi:hypothetical protein
LLMNKKLCIKVGKWNKSIQIFVVKIFINFFFAW